MRVLPEGGLLNFYCVKAIKPLTRKFIISNEGREFMDRTNGMWNEGTPERPGMCPENG